MAFLLIRAILIIVGLIFRIPLGPLAFPTPSLQESHRIETPPTLPGVPQWNRLAHAFTCKNPPMVIQKFQNAINDTADARALGLCTRQFTKARIGAYRRFES